MSPFPDTDGTLEQCVDDIGEFIATLEHYPAPVLACALRVQLEGLLRALLENGVCTRAQAGEFLRDLGREVLDTPGG